MKIRTLADVANEVQAEFLEVQRGVRPKRTIQTSARVWLEQNVQLRFEIQQTPNGRCSLCISLWAQEQDGWHPLTGGVLSGWRRPLEVITALCRSWIAFRVRSFSGRLNRPDRGGE